MVFFDNYQHVINGIAMSDIEPDGISLEVFPTEIIPGATGGGFKAATTTNKFKQKNEQGTTITTTANTTNRILAVWRSFNGESKPNNVRAGQQVILYQVGDTDKWYWSFKARDPEMGTTDYRVHYVPARKQEHTGKLPTDEDSYVQGIDTTKGRVIYAKTSQKLGEPVAFNHFINTKIGLYMLTDNKGVTIKKEKGLGNVKVTMTDGQYSNTISMDAANNTIQLMTSNGSFIQIVKEDIMIHAQRDFIVNAGRQIVFNAPTTTVNAQQKGAIVLNAANIAFNATGSIVCKAAVFGVNAVTKITQALVTAAIRCSRLVTGSTGSAYSPVTTNPDNGSNSPPNNSPDTDTTGAGDRNMAAYPQVEAAFTNVAQLIWTLSQAHTTGDSAPLNLDTSGITTNATASECPIIKGE